MAHKFYITHTQLERLESLEFESDGLPTQHDVVDWLREERNLHIQIKYDEGEYPWQFDITDIFLKSTKSSYSKYITYWDCLNAAINASIDILERGAGIVDS